MRFSKPTNYESILLNFPSCEEEVGGTKAFQNIFFGTRLVQWTPWLWQVKRSSWKRRALINLCFVCLFQQLSSLSLSCSSSHAQRQNMIRHSKLIPVSQSFRLSACQSARYASLKFCQSSSLPSCKAYSLVVTNYIWKPYERF